MPIYFITLVFGFETWFVGCSLAYMLAHIYIYIICLSFPIYVHCFIVYCVVLFDPSLPLSKLMQLAAGLSCLYVTLSIHLSFSCCCRVCQVNG